MVNPSLTYDTEYNRRLASILTNFDDIEASRNSPTMVTGGSRQMRYINSGSTPYDGREGTASFSGSMYGGYHSGGVNHLKKAKKWTNFLGSLVPPEIKAQGIKYAVKAMGGRRSGGEMNMAGYDQMQPVEMGCGGVNHLKKAKKWTGFLGSLVPPEIKAQGIKYAVKAMGGRTSGGATSGGRKVNHLKKAKEWTGFLGSLIPPEIKAQGVKTVVKALGGRRSGGVHRPMDPMTPRITGLKKPMASKATGYGRKSARGAIVAQVMKEHGLSLPQASKYVKEHGLY